MRAGVWVGAGVNVVVDVGVRVGVEVGVWVGAGVNVVVDVGVQVSVEVGVGVKEVVAVRVGVWVGTGVNVVVDVCVRVSVEVGVGVKVSVGVSVAVEVPGNVSVGRGVFDGMERRGTTPVRNSVVVADRFGCNRASEVGSLVGSEVFPCAVVSDSTAPGVTGV